MKRLIWCLPLLALGACTIESPTPLADTEMNANVTLGPTDVTLRLSSGSACNYENDKIVATYDGHAMEPSWLPGDNGCAYVVFYLSTGANTEGHHELVVDDRTTTWTIEIAVDGAGKTTAVSRCDGPVSCDFDNI